MATSAIVTVPHVDGELEIPCDMLDVNEDMGSLSLFRFDKATRQFVLWAHFPAYTHVYMVDDGKGEDPEVSAFKAALLSDEDEDDEDEDYENYGADDEDDEDEDEDESADEAAEVVVLVPAEVAEPEPSGPVLNSFPSSAAA